MTKLKNSCEDQIKSQHNIWYGLHFYRLISSCPYTIISLSPQGAYSRSGEILCVVSRSTICVETVQLDRLYYMCKMSLYVVLFVFVNNVLYLDYILCVFMDGWNCLAFSLI